MVDKIGRRSRFSRQPTGKRICLNSRDLDLFELLYRYRYLDSEQLIRWFKPKSQKRFIERLGDLYHEKGIVERPEQQKRHFNARFRPMIYSLSKLGYTVLQRTNLPIDQAVPFAQSTNSKIVQFEHAVETSRCVFEIELAIKEQSERRFVSQDEIFTKASKKLGRKIRHAEFPVRLNVGNHFANSSGVHATTIIPDAVFGIETLSSPIPGYRFYALEVERTNPLLRRTFDQPSSLKKLITYQKLIESRLFQQVLGIPNLFVVFACADAAHLDNIIRLSKDIWTREQRRFLLYDGLAENNCSDLSIHQKRWMDHFGFYCGQMD